MYAELKKSPKVDLERRKPLIFSISLFITMILVVIAFEYRFYDGQDVDVVNKGSNQFEELPDVARSEIQPPPPPSKLIQPQIVEVPDEEIIEEEIKIDLNVEMNEMTKVEVVARLEEPKIEDDLENSNEIFVVVEQRAEPKDGLASFYRYVNENIKYPAQARRMLIQGKVFVEFVVNKDGSLTDFSIVKGIGAGCDEEALRVVQNSPPWMPAKQRGKPVRQRMVLPITFKLANSDVSP